MEFSKKKLLSILEEVNTLDVDEMARRPKGTRARKEGDAPPKFEPGWKENNPTPPGGEGIPDYWVVNPNQVEGEGMVFVPVTCREIEKFINDNKEWLDSLGVLHNITESPQVIYCERGLPVTHRVAEKIFAGGYKASGDKIPVGERIKRYSNRKKGEGFYDIIEKYFETGPFADYLRFSSVPPIKNRRENIDRYSDAEITNDRLTFKMISFDKYESLQDFLKNVIEKIRPIANFRIPDENKPTYDSGDYLARLFNKIYRKWDPERKTDKSFYGYTEKYQLKRIGYEEDDINVMSSTYFEINGLLNRANGTYTWKISMSVKFGKKLQEDQRVGRLTEDKFIEHTKVVELDPDVVGKFGDEYTIMDNFDIKQGLIEAITDFQSKVKEQITPQDALRLGRLTYASTQKLDEQDITKLIQNVIKETNK